MEIDNDHGKVKECKTVAKSHQILQSFFKFHYFLYEFCQISILFLPTLSSTFRLFLRNVVNFKSELRGSHGKF